MSNVSAVVDRLLVTDVREWACVPDAPLACATGGEPERCLNSGRRCATAAENAHEPWVEIEWSPTAGYYLWAVDFRLPPSLEVSRLVVGKARLTLFGPRSTPVPCAGGADPLPGAPDNFEVRVLCPTATATDDDLRALGEVRRMRLQLLGDTSRYIWLESITFVERELRVATVLTASPPPPMRTEALEPPPPMSPPSSAPTCCVWGGYEVQLRDGQVRREEGCGVGLDACCAAAAERGSTSVFEIDHAGCCAVYEMGRGGNATVRVATAHGRLSELWRVGSLAHTSESCAERPV